jgi:nitrite reductase/ring-hydroxylating ferredoxin subunit
MMEPVVVCQVSDLAATGCFGFVIGTGDWPTRGFVTRAGDGQIRAWLNRCPHAGHRLELREHDFLSRDGQFIQCRSHGALFNPVDGRCVAGPCTGRYLREISVQVWGETIRIAPPQ